MLIDTHCHFPEAQYGKSEDEIVKEAAEADVVKLINIGTSLEDCRKVLTTLQKFPNVYGALGIYPHEEIDKNVDELILELEKLIDSPEKVAAIGE